jgi:GNAT superfamily N-acetyltransferase
MSNVAIRIAGPEDADTIYDLVRRLASYEKLSHEVVSTPEHFRRALTDPRSTLEVLIAETEGQTVGFALYFETFSTFVGRPGLYLEDLFVLPQYRRNGIANALFDEILRLADRRNYGRIEWSVLDWNEPAIQFYTRKRGAKILREWLRCRITLAPRLELGRMTNDK